MSKARPPAQVAELCHTKVSRPRKNLASYVLGARSLRRTKVAATKQSAAPAVKPLAISTPAVMANGEFMKKTVLAATNNTVAALLRQARVLATGAANSGTHKTSAAARYW